MTKADIVEALCAKIDGLTEARALEYADLVFDQIKQTLSGGEAVKISRFGKFSVRNKKKRIGRDLHTGAPHIINARNVVTFAPCSKLRETVNRLE